MMVHVLALFSSACIVFAGLMRIADALGSVADAIRQHRAP